MARLESLEDRRRWQNSVTETLFVGVLSGPGGTDPAEFALTLGTQLASIRQPRRTLPSVALWEGDFWSPRLGAWLRRFRAKDRGQKLFRTEGWEISGADPSGSAPRGADLFSLYEDVAGDYRARNRLAPTNGIPRTDSDLERWREQLLADRKLEPTRLVAEAAGQDERSRRRHTLLCFPARDSQSGFGGLLERGPRRLVAFPTEEEGELAGMAVVRGLLAATARDLGAGIVLLTLPQAYNEWTLMAINRVADVVVLPFDEVSGVRPLEPPWLPMLEAVEGFLRERRPRYALRPHFEKNYLFSLSEKKPPPSISELGETITLPSIRLEGSEEGGSKKKSGRAKFWLRLQALARRLDLHAASKAAGVEQVEFEEDYDPDQALAEALEDLPDKERKIHVRVEKGTYGERPIQALAERSAESGPLATVTKFQVVPHGIDHQDWFEQVVQLTAAEHDETLYQEIRKGDKSEDGQEKPDRGGSDEEKSLRPVERERRRLEKELQEEPLDLIAFPYYMLGALAENDLILPLHALEDCLDPESRERQNLTERTLTRGFHWVDDMCRYQGVLYAAPYIFTQKLLLVKKEEAAPDAPTQVADNWGHLKEQFKRNEAGWPLVLETAGDHVGVWYDWLEMVFVHGSNDFLRSGERIRGATREGRGAAGSDRLGFRASDYGECELTAAATTEATELYLDLHHRAREQLEKLTGNPEVDWDRILPVFLEQEQFWATVVWSDMAAFHWANNGESRGSEGGTEAEPGPDQGKEEPLGLEDFVRAYAFPPASPKGRVSVEGWVLGAPAYLRDDKERLRLVAHFLAWFLDARTQIRFAEAGGSTTRSDVGHALGEIPRLVHRTVANATVEPALKITFREAPVVIERLRRAIVGKWINGYPDTEFLEKELEELSRRLVERVLRDKARFRKKEYWSAQAEEGSEA